MDIVELIGIIWGDVLRVQKCLQFLLDQNKISLKKEVIAYYFPIGDKDKCFQTRFQEINYKLCFTGYSLYYTLDFCSGSRY